MNSPHFDSTRRPRRGRLVVALVTTLLLIGMVGACSANNDPEPSDSIPTASPSPTPAHEAWKADASEEEIALFEEAALWLQNYEDREFSYFEQGKATQEAKEFFQDHRADWQIPWGTLQRRAESKVTAVSDGTVLWRKPTDFALVEEPSIVIVTCVDVSTLKFEGAKVTAPDHPVIFETYMSKMKDRGWTIFSDKIPEKENECEK